MNTLLLAVIVYIGFIIAYNTYGRFLGSKIFNLSKDNVTPAHALRDNVDYVPTRREILFGHHFASIAGTGPIVGPAIGVIWGWVPAILWVVFGSIFVGAVHDLGSLVVSARRQGKTLGEITEELVSPTSRTLFLLVIFFCLLIVIAIFAMIIGNLFIGYPESVFPIWMEIPIAVTLGYLVYKRNANVTWLSIAAIILMYVTVWMGTFLPIRIPGFIGGNVLLTWVVILLIYGYIASVLPVQTLLQPRDYINAHELLVAMLLLFAGLAVAHPPIAAPAVVASPPGAPPVFPFLFITIACGAISGFHSLVSSGTSSKQLNDERDARFVGYGGMLMEGALATLVIAACIHNWGNIADWGTRYAAFTKVNGIASFVEGGGQFLAALGLSPLLAKTILAVFVVSFAGTTIDTATRLQRYVVAELAEDFNVKFLANRYVATLIATGSALLLALARPDGSGANILWPLFGASNQLLGGLALLVITIYLAKSGKPIVYTFIPMVFMIIMTGWGMLANMYDFYTKQNWLLFGIDVAILLLEIWMIVEAIRALVNAIKVRPGIPTQA